MIRIWYMECKEPVLVRFISDSSQGITQIKIRFSGYAGDWEGHEGQGGSRGFYFCPSKRKEKSSIGNGIFVHTE